MDSHRHIASSHSKHGVTSSDCHKTQMKAVNLHPGKRLAELQGNALVVQSPTSASRGCLGERGKSSLSFCLMSLGLLVSSKQQVACQPTEPPLTSSIGDDDKYSGLELRFP